MSWLRVHGLRGLAASVAGPTLQVPPPPQRPTHRPGRGQGDVTAVRLPGLTGAPPKVVRDRVRHLLVMFAPDDSGSTSLTDPQGTRYVAAHSVVELMRRHGGGRAGVVHWGDQAPTDLALPPVSVSRERAQLNHSLGLRPQLGGTEPAVALARVRQVIPLLENHETLVVILLTDGQDLGATLQQELAQLPPRSVHLVLVDPSGDCCGREDAWRALPWGSFTSLENFNDATRVAWQSGAILARAIGLDLPPLSMPSRK